MTRVVILVAVLALARTASGQNADDYRGGWRTESGEPHTYEFSIKGTTARGIYCTFCADATTLARGLRAALDQTASKMASK